MKVKATEKCFYKRLYKPGDVFHIPDDPKYFSPKYMEVVEEVKTKKKGRPTKSTKKEAIEEVIGGE